MLIFFWHRFVGTSSDFLFTHPKNPFQHKQSINIYFSFHVDAFQSSGTSVLSKVPRRWKMLWVRMSRRAWGERQVWGELDWRSWCVSAATIPLVLGAHETERNYHGWREQRVSRKAFVIHCDHQRRIFTITSSRTSVAVATSMVSRMAVSKTSFLTSSNANYAQDRTQFRALCK